LRRFADFARRRATEGLVAAALIVAAAAGTPQSAAAADPTEPVKRLNAVLLDAMQNADSLGYGGRFDLLDPVLQNVFNFSRMAQSAIGRTWSASGDAQRQSIVDVFTRLSIAEFASRFDGFSGERFEVGAAVELPRGWVLVENDLVQADGERIAINYIVREADGRWQIYDIRLNNTISELQLKRDEYTSVLRSTDLDELVQLLEGKIVRLSGT